MGGWEQAVGENIWGRGSKVSDGCMDNKQVNFIGFNRVNDWERVMGAAVGSKRGIIQLKNAKKRVLYAAY